MNEILLPVLIVAGIGLLCGLGLAIASIVMAVPKDEKAEAIEEILPGANCSRRLTLPGRRRGGRGYRRASRRRRRRGRI